MKLTARGWWASQLNPRLFEVVDYKLSRPEIVKQTFCSASTHIAISTSVGCDHEVFNTFILLPSVSFYH